MGACGVTAVCASPVPQPRRATAPLAIDAVLSVGLQICTHEELLRKFAHASPCNILY